MTVHLSFPPKCISTNKLSKHNTIATFNKCNYAVALPSNYKYDPLDAKRVSYSVRTVSKQERNPQIDHKSTTNVNSLTKFSYVIDKINHTDKYSQYVAKVKIPCKSVSKLSKITPNLRTPCAIPVKTLSVTTKYSNCFSESIQSSREPPLPSKRIDAVDRPSIAKNRSALVGRWVRRKQNELPSPSSTIPRKACCAKSNDTENKLLIQISEAHQVSDFQRILKSNAISCRRENDLRRPHTGASDCRSRHQRRPRSNYSVTNVSETYHHLFKRHLDSVQCLIGKLSRENLNEYSERRDNSADASILGNICYEDLYNLSEYYDDDPALREELEEQTASRSTEQKVEENSVKEEETKVCNGNCNFELTKLISKAEVCCKCADGSQTSSRRGCVHREVIDLRPFGSRVPSADASEDEREPSAGVMNGSQDERNQGSHTVGGNDIDGLARAFTKVHLEKNDNLPIITFSNCCDSNASASDLHDSSGIKLSVPSIECRVEARPPA